MTQERPTQAEIYMNSFKYLDKGDHYNFVFVFGEERFKSLNEKQKFALMDFVYARMALMKRIIAVSIAIENEEEIPKDSESLVVRSARTEQTAFEASQTGVDLETLNDARMAVDFLAMPIKI